MEKPTAVLAWLKRKRGTEQDPHHRVSRSVGAERKRDTSRTGEESRRSVCQQVLKAFKEGVRERWRERESERLLIWMHRPSPVSAHSNVCPARLTRPRVAPITHNPALPTALARHRFEGFTEQILAVVHIKVEPSPCVVRLQFMGRTKRGKKEPSPNPPINELSSHLVTRHLKSHIKFERFLYRKRGGGGSRKKEEPFLKVGVQPCMVRCCWFRHEEVHATGPTQCRRGKC